MKALRSIGLALLLGTVAPAMLPGCDSSPTSDEQNATATQGKFETFLGQNDEHYFQLIAANGERILRSEGYTTLTNAKKGISSVKKNGVIEARFKLLEAVNGEHYFNLVAANGEIIGTSETYVSKSNAERARDTVLTIIKAAQQVAAPKKPAKFETFQGVDNQYYFRLRAGNGAIVLQSEGYTKKSNAEKGITAVKKNGVSPDSFEVVEAQNGQHYFRIVAANHEPIGRGEMYVSKTNAARGARTVRDLLRDMSNANVSDEQVRRELEDAAEGAIYVSESDYPFEYVVAPLNGQNKVTEALVREKLASYVDEIEDADKPMAELFAMEGEFDEWRTDYKQCDEDSYPGPEECAEVQELVEALDQNLTGIKVFYFGGNGEPGSVDGVAVTIFIVGLSPEGNLVGVRTIAIWT